MTGKSCRNHRFSWVLLCDYYITGVDQLDHLSVTGNYNTFWESKLSIIITMKRNQQHGSKSINNNLQTWPFEPTEESRMFPEKPVIYFPLDVSCLLQSAAMVAKKLLVGAKITACFKQICFCMLLCKFRSEKHIWWNIFLSWKRLLSIFKFRASSNLSIVFYELLIGPQPTFLECIVIFL